MNRLIFIALLLVLAVGGAALYEQRERSAPAAEIQPAPQSVSTVPVSVAPMVNGVAGYGNLVSRRAVNIAPDSPGVVREIKFIDGQQVAAGTPLVLLDSSIAEAQLQAAHAQAETDVQNLRRTQSLSRQGLDSTYSLEQAQSRASVSEADVKINERKLAMLTLRAPFAGRLGSRSVDVGALVTVGQTIVRLEDSSELQIEFRVPSAVGLQVQQGLPVHIQLPAADGTAEGTLSFIDPTISSDTRSVLLRALVSYPGPMIRPGMFVRVALDLSTHEHALVIPVGAVTSELTGAFVYVVDDKNIAHRRDVTLGLNDGERYEVLSGLKAGDRVVTVGQFRLRDGDAVKVVPRLVGNAGPKLMGLSNFCIRRPVFTIVINLILLVMGLWSAQHLQIRQYPRIVLPSITVVTVFPGADPALVERQVSAQLEAAIGAASGIETMTSTSQEGASTIQVSFNAGVDPSAALNDVRAKVSAGVARLPPGTLAPVITQVSTDGQPILYLAFADGTMSDMAVTAFVQREMVPRLTAIPGVAQAQLIGDRKYAIRLRLDPVRMAAYGVTVQDVENALAQQNIETPGGQIRRDDYSVSVLVDTTLDDLSAFDNIALRRGEDGFIVRLSSVGKAVVGPDQALTTFRYSGKSAVAIGLVPQSTANPLEISQAVDAMLPDLRAVAPRSMVIENAFDTSISVKASVEEVAKTVFIATGLVLLVIIAFIGTLRTSLIPMVTIPLSLLGTLMFIDLLGFSINIFSLLAMVLAVGLVVDDAIVEVENTQRHVDAGMTAMDATFFSSQEVGFAVIATTITLASVFAPMGLAGGTIGQIFREFAFTLAIAILLSGFIARTLSPMMCGRLIYPRAKRGYSVWITRQTERAAEVYRRAILRLLDHRWPVVLGVVMVVVLTGFIAGKIPGSVSPHDDTAYVVLKFAGPPGASLDYLSRWNSRAESFIARQPEVANTLVMVGIPLQNEALAIVSFKPWDERTRTSTQITNSIMADLQGLAGLEPTIFASDPLAGVGAGQPVQWILKTSGSYESLAAAAGAVIDATRHAHSMQNVTVDLHIDTPKIVVSVDRAAAEDVGVPVATIGATIQSLFGGQRASTFIYRGDIYSVIIELPRDLAAKSATLDSVYVTSRSGDLIPLSSLITITHTAGAAVLARNDQMNSATLGADPLPGHSVQEATAELKAIAESVLPPGVRITSSATVRAMEQSAIGMAMVMGLAIIFIYLVLCAQFESFRDPVIILAVVPLTICGAIVGLYLFGGTYNLYSGIGFIALVGLIAKHGILIVEFTNQLRDQGRDLHDALVEASALRLRPILMTAIATILGAMPLTLATGAGAGGRSEIGIVLTAGMTFGTVVSLFVLPAVYSLLAKRTRHKLVPLPDFMLSAAAVSRHGAE